MKGCRDGSYHLTLRGGTHQVLYNIGSVDTVLRVRGFSYADARSLEHVGLPIRDCGRDFIRCGGLFLSYWFCTTLDEKTRGRIREQYQSIRTGRYRNSRSRGEIFFEGGNVFAKAQNCVKCYELVQLPTRIHYIRSMLADRCN